MIEKEMKMNEVKKEIIKVEEVDIQSRHLMDDMTSPSASPPPPTASPVLAAESPGGSPDDQNAPIMLTTMQPVPLNIMDLPKDYMSQSYVDDERHQEFIYQVDGKNVEIVRQDDLPPGTVSVVVQQPGGLLPAYQTPGTTVLVLSELVEDIGTVRKNGKEGTRAYLLPSSPVGVGQGRMSEALPGGGGGEQYYYEHPLTAATTAMLNISSSANDEPNGTMGYVYEYYKLPPMPQDKDKLAEIWPATSSASGIASQTKATNGLAGGELAPPIGDLQGLFLHGQQLKREPEDLSHHRKSPSDLDGGIIKGARQKVLLVTPGGEDLVVDVVNNNSIKDGLSSPQHGGRSVNGTPTSTGSVLVEQPVELIATADGLKPAMSYSTQIFSPMANATHSAHSGTPSPNPYNDHGGQYTTSSQGGISAGYITTSAGAIRGSASSAFTVSDPYYREYFSGEQTYVRQQVPVYADSPEGAGGTIASGTSAFVDRYVRGQNTTYHSKGVIAAAGLTVDLPSPDSGIGADTVTPRDQTQIQQSFDYTDLCQAGILSDQRVAGGPQQSPGQGQGRSRPWHDFGRQNDADKIQIPKIYSNYGFKYHLETPISTSQRREDDRITYINKGQFYGITLDYIPDPEKPLKSQTVKSIVMLMFREEKSPEDEIKAWQFWHGRQHSVKQRILDADTKNSVGLVGCIEEVSHNAIAVFWNPLESSAKINVAVQCLSTDFSSQKGVKGLPLHLQIDTYEDPRDGPVYHRGYCQIKVFCDKMENTENFPLFVCENCYDLIRLCYNFSRVCQRSDLSLRNCHERTLQEIKAQFCTSENEKVVEDDDKSNQILNDVNCFVSDTNLSDLLDIEKAPTKRDEEFKWRPTLRQKSNVILKAGNIKQKYQKMNSLSERLKEARMKLAEDILRSNDMMLGLPKTDELHKALSEDKSSYECPQCSLKFNNPEALKFHYVATHGPIRKLKTVNKLQCRKCVRCFSDQEGLIRHYESFHKVDKSELSDEDLNHKVRKSVRTGKRKFYCLHCVPYKIYQSRDKLVEHLEEYHKDGDTSERKSQNISKVYGCSHCKSDTSFLSKFELNSHLRTVHNLKEDDITWKDIKLTAKTEENPGESSDLKLFKVFVCTDCSPPVSFTNVNVCVQHKVDTHDKQLENIPLKELTPVYVDSPNVFKQSNDQGKPFCLKVFCKNCDPPVDFPTASGFVNHMSSFHENSNVENWDIETKPVNDLLPNDSGKKESQLWKCSDCPASYFRRQSLFYHSKEKHNKILELGAMKCPEPDCTESFFINRQLIQHGISVHEKYFANFHKIFTKKILQPSTEEENRIKNFECDICEKRYVCKNSLKRHILKTHLGRADTEKVVCTYCGKTVSNKVNLKSHIEFVHEAVFVSCPICKKKINFRTIGKHYKTHQTSPSMVDQFLCNLCGKILKSKRGFEDHQKVHKNVRDQLCDICGSGFTTKKFLNLHKKTHQGSQRKVFECPQCDKVFSGRHTLNRHLLTHSGEKNFICEICSKCFYTLQELNRHVRYHKKEYRFDCQLCDMRFLDKSRFRHHMMRHRNIRPHKCSFCDKMFIVRRKMNLHMAAKHNVQVKNTKAVWKDPKTYIPLDDLL